MKTNCILSVSIAALFAAVAANSHAGLITYQNGSTTPFAGGTYSGTDDAMMITNGGGYFHSAAENFGARLDMEVGNAGTLGPDANRRILIRFDLSSLNGQYTAINSATLRLHVAATPVSGSGAVNIFQITNADADWVEGVGVAANGFNVGDNDVGGATWAKKIQGSTTTTGTPWAGGGTTGSANGGAGVAGVDYVATAVNSSPLNFTTATSGFVDFNFADLSLISTWATGPTNGGLLIRMVNDGSPGTNRLNFDSSEISNTAFRPQLIIDFAPVPEPTGALTGLLCLGLAGMRRRRRSA